MSTRSAPAPITQHESYKVALKAKVLELRSGPRPITLRKLAEAIPVQATYLSKVLNHDGVHLGEDQLFRACRRLGFLREETDYLMLLRSHESSMDAERKEYLLGKIEKLRRSKDVGATVRDFNSLEVLQDAAYLVDPLCAVAHVALQMAPLRKDPRALSGSLGISLARMREIYRKLAQLGFIEWDEKSMAIKSVRQSRIHYATDHPLMRAHQALLRTLGAAKTLSSPENIQKQFMVTFSAEPSVSKQVQEIFLEFVQTVERLAVKSRSQNVYQMNFELFRWL